MFEEFVAREDSRTGLLVKSLALVVSLVVHVVFTYVLFTARFKIKIFPEQERTVNVFLSPAFEVPLPSDVEGLIAGLPEPAGEEFFPPSRGMRKGTEPGGELETRAVEGESGGGSPEGSGIPGGLKGFNLIYPLQAKPSKEEEPLFELRRELGVTGTVYGRGDLPEYLRGGGKYKPYAYSGISGKNPTAGSHSLAKSRTGNRVVFTGKSSPAIRAYDISPWAQDVVSLVQRNWILPASEIAGTAVRVGITLIVEKTGKLSTVRIVDSSKSTPFDKAALDALAASLPLPRLPDDFPEAFLEAYLLFEYNVQ